MIAVFILLLHKRWWCYVDTVVALLQIYFKIIYNIKYRTNVVYSPQTLLLLVVLVPLPYILAYKSDFWEWKIIWKLGFRLIGATYVKNFFTAPKSRTFNVLTPLLFGKISSTIPKYNRYILIYCNIHRFIMLLLFQDIQNPGD